ELHESAVFDPETDVVIQGTGETEGRAERVRVETQRETADLLQARVEAPAGGVLVWARSYFSAWQATVDGKAAPRVRADGQVVGGRVSAGPHEVIGRWSAGRVLGGGLLSLAGLSAALRLRRS